MSPEVIIRRFQSGDAERLTELWRNVLPSSKPWNDPRSALCRKIDRGDQLVFVAQQEDSIVGGVIAGYDGIRGWIYSLAVAASQRKSGIGRRLVSEAEAALVGLGCPKVNVQVRDENAEVVEFYRRCGYDAEPRISLGKPLPDGDTTEVPSVQISDTIRLSTITTDDRQAYLQHLNETDEIHFHTASLPYPYTPFDADRWIAGVNRKPESTGGNLNWAIRHHDDLIGAIGLMQMTVGEMAELGYWLAKPFWGRGIMTSVACRLCDFGFEHFELQRIHAKVFATNPRSARVLTNAGFRLEGTLRQHFYRDGQGVDVLVFGRLRDDV